MLFRHAGAAGLLAPLNRARRRASLRPMSEKNKTQWSEVRFTTFGNARELVRVEKASDARWSGAMECRCGTEFRAEDVERKGGARCDVCGFEVVLTATPRVCVTCASIDNT